MTVREEGCVLSWKTCWWKHYPHSLLSLYGGSFKRFYYSNSAPRQFLNGFEYMACYKTFTNDQRYSHMLPFRRWYHSPEQNTTTSWDLVFMRVYTDKWRKWKILFTKNLHNGEFYTSFTWKFCSFSSYTLFYKKHNYKKH